MLKNCFWNSLVSCTSKLRYGIHVAFPIFLLHSLGCNRNLSLSASFLSIGLGRTGNVSFFSSFSFWALKCCCSCSFILFSFYICLVCESGYVLVGKVTCQYIYLLQYFFHLQVYLSCLKWPVEGKVATSFQSSTDDILLCFLWEQRYKDSEVALVDGFFLICFFREKMNKEKQMQCNIWGQLWSGTRSQSHMIAGSGKNDVVPQMSLPASETGEIKFTGVTSANSSLGMCEKAAMWVNACYSPMKNSRITGLDSWSSPMSLSHLLVPSLLFQ